MAARVEGPAVVPVPSSFYFGLPFRSLISKLVLLLVIFCAVPVILYIQFREADAEKRVLLMESVREQGRMVAVSLRPLLEQQEVSSLPLLNDEVARFATKQRSEEHTSELQSLMRISYAVFCLKKKNKYTHHQIRT